MDKPKFKRCMRCGGNFLFDEINLYVGTIRKKHLLCKEGIGL